MSWKKGIGFKSACPKHPLHDELSNTKSIFIFDALRYADKLQEFSVAMTAIVKDQAAPSDCQI